VHKFVVCLHDCADFCKHYHTSTVSCTRMQNLSHHPHRLLKSWYHHSYDDLLIWGQAVRKTAATFAPRASSAKSKNPAQPGSTLYTIFEVQAYASMLVGGVLSFNLLFPSDQPDIWRLMGMWSVWMFSKSPFFLFCNFRRTPGHMGFDSRI